MNPRVSPNGLAPLVTVPVAFVSASGNTAQPWAGTNVNTVSGPAVPFGAARSTPRRPPRAPARRRASA